jgi:hypothetical protein
MQGSAVPGRLLFVHGSHPHWPLGSPGPPARRRVDRWDVALIVVPVLLVILVFLLASLL